MRIPPSARVYLTSVISLAGVALAALSGAQVAAGGPDRLTPQNRCSALRAETEQAAVDAAVAMRVTLNDALDPIVRQVGRVATAASRHEREALREAAVSMVVDSAAHLVGSGRVRACLFQFAAGAPRVLMPTQYSVLVYDPLEPIVEGA